VDLRWSLLGVKRLAGSGLFTVHEPAAALGARSNAIASNSTRASWEYDPGYFSPLILRASFFLVLHSAFLILDDIL
jgi:hypothetical protein